MRTLGVVAKYYHGGAAGFRPGDVLLPPSETGSGSLHDETTEQYGAENNPHRRDRVYVTTRIDVAFFYAVFGGAPGRRAGAVYLVEPRGPLEPDPDQRATFACTSATVVTVPFGEVAFTPENQRTAAAIYERFRAQG